MYHQREKYHLISIATLALSVLLGIIAIFKHYYLMILLSLFLIAISIISDALLLNVSFRRTEGLKQLIQGVMLFILITFLFVIYINKL